MTSFERRRRGRWAREFWTLAKPFWTSEARWIASAQLLFIVAVTLTIVYLSVWLNGWYQRFYDIVGRKDPAVYFRFLLQYVAVAAFWTAIARMKYYVNFRLQLSWREWMTRRFLTLWLQDQKHYFWALTQRKTDNPDQRIAEDVQTFISSSLGLSLDLLDKVVTLISFVGVLWGLSGVLRFTLPGGKAIELHGYLVWASLAYATTGNGLAYWIGRSMIPLKYEQQHREADFRAGLIRIREHSEGIALARGEQAEIASSLGLFARVVTNFRKLIRKYVQVDLFNVIHSQVRSLFPMFAAAPRLLAGEIQVGGLFQITGAVEHVEGSISFLVTSMERISDWRAATSRLVDLEESLRRAAAIREETRGKMNADGAGGRLGVQSVDVLTPEGRKLLDQVTLEIRAGERALFEGVSGTGKSTFFRMLAGIWPFYRGTIQAPAPESRVFVSQTPYLPLGTLRDALLYPDRESPISDSELQRQLRAFGLGHLAAELMTSREWQHILAPGERQRIVLIRAILKKPKWLFLDEATSSLDGESQDRAYRTVLAALPDSAIVSIGHREALEELHGKRVLLGAAGAKAKTAESAPAEG